MTLELCCLDMAGTTVSDEGLVITAFETALTSVALEASEISSGMVYLHETMGRSKIEVFKALVGDRAHAANGAFEEAYAALVASRGLKPIDGAAAAIEMLHSKGLKVCLTTGFSRTTADMVLAKLGWESIADLTLCPSDAGRGRPAPDLILTALVRLEISSVDAVLVAGDTPSDMEAARRAGSTRRIGVLTGGFSDVTLRNSGASEVLPSIAALTL